MPSNLPLPTSPLVQDAAFRGHEGPGAARSLWRWQALLALPFVVCAVFLLVTGHEFLVFWGSDEGLYHWPLILRFARDFPDVDWRYPLTATTPLFHLLCALVVRAFGANIQFIRMLNAVVSLGGVLALFRMLVRSRAHSPSTAALLATVFLSSCYFFGYSFRLLTDNLAVTCCILAMAQLYRFAETAEARGLSAFVRGCLWLCLTVLTRQNYLVLGLPFLVTLLAAPMPVSRKALGAVVLALSVVPFAILVSIWHGLVPPDFQQRHTSSLLHAYTAALPLVLLGFYAPFILGPGIYQRLVTHRLDFRRWRWPIGVAALVGLVLVAAFPLYPLVGQEARAAYLPAVAWTTPGLCFAGWIYFLASHLPALHGNSLVFWVLLPVGLAAAAGIGVAGFRREAPLAERLAPLFLLAVVIASMINPISAQKYYDGLVLLSLLWFCPPEPSRQPLRNLSLIGLVIAFCGYNAVYILLFHPGASS